MQSFGRKLCFVMLFLGLFLTSRTALMFSMIPDTCRVVFFLATQLAGSQLPNQGLNLDHGSENTES